MSIYVVGNWKMNLLRAQANELAANLMLHGAVSDVSVQVVICPPTTALETVIARCADRIAVGAQNCHHTANGAFTGEVSAEMLSDVGCAHVILGHSERRRDQHETDADIGRKVRHAHEVGLRPIVCIGETLDQRQRGITFDVLKEQINGIISTAGLDAVAASLVAYEPVWAIGTGLAATTEQAQEVHAFLRDHLALQGVQTHVPLLYGGSVTPSNAAELFACRDIDGALVGGASLKAIEFAQIVQHARNVGA